MITLKDLEFKIASSTQFANVYLRGKLIATFQRCRVLSRSGPAWRLHDTDGGLIWEGASYLHGAKALIKCLNDKIAADRNLQGYAFAAYKTADLFMQYSANAGDKTNKDIAETFLMRAIDACNEIGRNAGLAPELIIGSDIQSESVSPMHWSLSVKGRPVGDIILNLSGSRKDHRRYSLMSVAGKLLYCGNAMHDCITAMAGHLITIGYEL